MLCLHCKTCRNPLHADDNHTEYVSRLGKSQADAAVSRADCSHLRAFQSFLSALAVSFFQRATPPLTPFHFLSSRDLFSSFLSLRFISLSLFFSRVHRITVVSGKLSWNHSSITVSNGFFSCYYFLPHV